VEEGHFLFNGAKSWPLIRPGMIPTVNSKLPSWHEQVTAERLVGLATLGRRRGCCVVRWQAIICVQVLLNLVERWSIKCPEKKATWTAFRRNQWWRRWTIPNDVSFGPSFFFLLFGQFWSKRAVLFKRNNNALVFRVLI